MAGDGAGHSDGVGLPRRIRVFTIQQRGRVTGLYDHQLHELMSARYLEHYQISRRRYIPASAASKILADRMLRRVR